MGARKAVRFLTVGDTTYAPGDEVPADAVALVDHPRAWVSLEDEAAAESDADEDDEPKKAAAKRSSK